MAKQTKASQIKISGYVVLALTMNGLSLQAQAQSSNRFIELGIISKQNLSDNKSEQKVIMNDPAISQAWGIEKSDAKRAWEVSLGSKNITVAVIDTGAQVNHEDLKNNIWVNAGETGLDKNGKDKATNGVDDDGNGYVDDVNGWNFVGNDNDLTDNHGHGTHIAGIIGAEAGNKTGIVGISPKVNLMVLKYFDPKKPNTDHLNNTIKAIRYATKMKVDIINYSGGGTEFSKEEKQAIEEARKQGILFVAAAGNEKSNSDVFKYYPADYGLDNIISVTAIDPGTQVLPTSNYGVETVDIAAPGQNILSTLPGNSYGYMTGTSQATAFVTGAAVLIKAARNNFSYSDIKKYILATGNVDRSLKSKTRTARVLNLYKSVTMLDNGISVSGVSSANNVEQVFTASAVAIDNTASELGETRSMNDQFRMLGKKMTESFSGKLKNGRLSSTSNN